MTPADSFVPLSNAPVPPAPREFRVAVVNPHTHADAPAGGEGAPKPGGFRSLESQRVAGLHGGGAGENKPGEPRVTLQRDGDRITHLRIQCSCGQVMDLACVYDPPAKPAA